MNCNENAMYDYQSTQVFTNLMVDSLGWARAGLRLKPRLGTQL